MALHLNNPLLEVPLLDGKFSPDGYNMIISTIYGSFSIYGYGDKEMFNYTYSE
jgi:bromodomain and WD repeat domain-containing protein 1/3